ncbi:MAG: response regulator [Opitutaceae bacterium]
MAKIFVIDDSDGVRETLAFTLGLAGHAVTAASNGPDGLWLAVDILPDLFMVDIQMPMMDGYSVCRAIKADGRFEHAKVLLMSSCADRNMREHAKLAGAEVLLDKVAMVSDLTGTVAAYLSDKAVVS